MAIIEDLLSTLDFEADLQEVRLGPYWAAVVTRNCGLASTTHDTGHHHGDTAVRRAGHIMDMTSVELAQLARSESPLEAAIGMATINSLIEVDETRCVDLNASELLLKQGRDRKVALVGHFPFTSRLREAAEELWVVEKRPREGDIAEGDAEDYIPKADLVAITGSALVNHTMEDLLDLCSPRALVVVLGPSTPLSPVLFDYGVDVISGTKVVEPQTVLRYVSQGATFRQMEGVRLLTMRS
jgi:uncharacterized protein (DUF4213/DUF364 family)